MNFSKKKKIVITFEGSCFKTHKYYEKKKVLFFEKTFFKKKLLKIKKKLLKLK